MSNNLSNKSPWYAPPLPQYVSVLIFDDPPPFPHLRTYLMDGLFFNQKTNKNIRISYSLKFNLSNKSLWYALPLFLYVPVHIFNDRPPFPQLCTYLMDGLFLNQKTNKNIPIPYSLK